MARRLEHKETPSQLHKDRPARRDGRCRNGDRAATPVPAPRARRSVATPRAATTGRDNGPLPPPVPRVTHCHRRGRLNASRVVIAARRVMTQEGRRNWPTHDSPLTLSRERFPRDRHRGTAHSNCTLETECEPKGCWQVENYLLHLQFHRGEITSRFVADLSFTWTEAFSDTRAGGEERRCSLYFAYINEYREEERQSHIEILSIMRLGFARNFTFLRVLRIKLTTLERN